jgi:hypothetical protein
MNEQSTSEQAIGDTLTEDELSLVAGGAESISVNF